MKGDVYYLKDTTDHNRIVAKFVVENDSHTLTGECFSAVSLYSDGRVCYYDYFADVYCKPDSCTQWNFYGEDYDPESKNEKDSYYHLYGAGCFMEHIRLMCFVWKLASMITGSGDDYFDNDEIKKLVDTMLKDYFIQKETTMYKCEKCVTDKSWCWRCKDNPKYANYPTLSYFSEYIPLCPHGYDDCVMDPAYIKFHHPEWYKKLYGDMTPEDVAAENCDPDDKCCYDDEDK